MEHFAKQRLFFKFLVFILQKNTDEQKERIG